MPRSILFCLVRLTRWGRGLMRNYTKEIVIGFVPVFILFMQFIVKVNMVPFVVMLV